MIITSHLDGKLGKPASKKKSGDLLDCEKINALPHPISLQVWSGDIREVESLCVETGKCRLLSCGMIDLDDFSSANNIVDADGVKHDADCFYNE